MAETNKPNFLLSLIFIVIIIFLFSHFLSDDYYVEHNSLEDANEFFSVFSYIANGDIDGFSNSLEKSLSFIGLFMILLTTIYFVFTKALYFIFESKRLALVMSLILTIYCYANNVIYNYILSLSVFVIALLVFIALILMLFGGTKEMYNNTKGEYDKANKLSKDNRKAREEIKKLLQSP
jgi:ABC-type multidrug transport system fused ATPase/permease subunit